MISTEDLDNNEDINNVDHGQMDCTAAQRQLASRTRPSQLRDQNHVLFLYGTV
jgi:hypothetical protein